MLLVHDHDADPFERSEDGGAGADHDRHLSSPDPPPLVVALPVGKAAVEDGDATAEAAFEPPHQLRREGDLRHQHQGGPALLQNYSYRAKVDLGLAAAGHAVQEKRRKRAGADRRREPGDGGGLAIVEHRRRVALEDFFPEGIAVDLPLRDGHQSLLPQPLQKRRVGRKFPAQERRGRLAFFLQECQDSRRLFPKRFPFRHNRGLVIGLHLDPLSAAQRFFRQLRPVRSFSRAGDIYAGGQSRLDNLAEGVDIIAGGPAEKFQFRRREQRLGVEDRDNVLQLFAARCRSAQHIAGELAPAERDQHARPRHRQGSELRRHSVVVRAVER